MSETENNTMSPCMRTCWISGGLLGLAAFLILLKRMEMGVLVSLIIGLVVMGIAALVIGKIFCGEVEPADAEKTAAPTKVAPEPVADPEPVKKAKAPAAKATAPAVKVKSKAAKPMAADGRPEALDSARDGGADNLKQIKGVGPKLEKLLNSMGFYHFDQIAAWRVKEVKWVDENLQGFKNRVSRDEWVKQAKVLAKGGTTEFSKKVKKGGVY